MKKINEIITNNKDLNIAKEIKEHPELALKFTKIYNLFCKKCKMKAKIMVLRGKPFNINVLCEVCLNKSLEVLRK